MLDDEAERDRNDSFSIHQLQHMWTQWIQETEPERHNKKAIEALLIIASTIAISVGRTREVGAGFLSGGFYRIFFAVERRIKTLTLQEGGIGNTMIFQDERKHSKALELHEGALAKYEKALCADYLDTLVMVNTGAYFVNENIAKALGVDRLNTLITVYNMQENMADLFDEIEQSN
ncbi:hypothetical protein BDZ91DRAFT_790246 [Kalaharituber pfeilii]|nr:hypothetical protein BDZ91DRAFT_790246 [Kalaharituber pfeilii]